MDDLSIGFDDWLLADDEELVWDANNASASKPTVEALEATETTNADLDDNARSKTMYIINNLTHTYRLEQ